MRVAAISALLAVAAAILISTATAAPKKAAAGTASVTDRTLVMSYRDGNDIVRELLVHRTLTGTYAGTVVSLVHNATHPDGSADLTVLDSCSCTVEGRTGTITFSGRAMIVAGHITVHSKIIDASGDLEGLRGTLVATDQDLAAPAQNYTGRYSFGKAKD